MIYFFALFYLYQMLHFFYTQGTKFVLNYLNMLQQPFPWYISGPLIALIMLLLLLTGKKFGMSSNLRTICSAIGAGRTCDFFCFDWKGQKWNLIVLAGAVLGGFVATIFFSGTTPPELNTDTLVKLSELGIASGGEYYLPQEIFGSDVISHPAISIILIVSGVFVGFGARYAGGCTSGHAISGLSNLQLPSLIAVVGFFIGGLVMTHFIFPLIF